MKYVKILASSLIVLAIIILSGATLLLSRSIHIRKDAQQQIDELMQIVTLSYCGSDCTFEAKLNNPTVHLSDYFHSPSFYFLNAKIQVIGAEGTALENAEIPYTFQFENAKDGLRFNSSAYLPGSYHGDWVSDLFFQLTVYLSGKPGNFFYDMEDVNRVGIGFDGHGYPLVDGEMDYVRPGDERYACHIVLTASPANIHMIWEY